MYIGPLTSKIGSTAAGGGYTGVNSAYNPIYVTDSSFSQLVRSDDIFGTNKVTFGGSGTGTNQFYGPRGAAVDSSGRIYVVDAINCRIVRVDDMNGTNWTTLGGTCGSGNNQFSTDGAWDIALDSTGRIYVADTGNNRIVRFDDMSGTNWTTFGTAGTGVNQLSVPSGVTVDSTGHIYIADSGNARIVRIDDFTGTNWVALTQSPNINGYIYLFGAPAHIAIDAAGRIVVADGTHMVRVDDMTGTNWAELIFPSSLAALSVGWDGTYYFGSVGVGLFDDFLVGAGYTLAPFITYPGGIYSIPVPNPTPALTISATSLTFAKQNVGTVSGSQSFTINNFGTGPLNFNSITVSGDFVSSNTCPAALPGGSNCTISVSYAPTVTGPESGAVTISDNAATGTQVVTLSGTGTAPVGGISPAALVFQPQLLGSTSGGELVMLTNSGTGALTFSGLGIATTGDFTQINNCGTALLPGIACQIVVSFTPTATGPRTGVLMVTSNAVTQSVTLAGTGAAAAPTIAALPESLFFTTELVNTKSAAQTVVFTNSGHTAVAVGGASTTGDFAWTGKCPKKLAIGASCTLSVTFTPTAAGTRSGTLTFNVTGGSVTLPLTGIGTSTAEGWLSPNPATVIFNDGYIIGDNPSQDVTITNTNGVPAGIKSIAMSGSKTFTQTNNCPKVLPAYGSCTITITFQPLKAGTFTGTLTVTESAGQADTVPIGGSASTSGG
jgi:sugar lactone lactonase YvrE